MYSSNVGKFRPDRTDITVYTEDNLGNPRLSSRLYKILSHIYDSQEWSVYVDADIFLPEGMEEKLIAELKESGKSIGVFKNPWRDNIYDEANEVIRLGKDDKEPVENQIKRYGQDVKGLAACGIIVRHHTEEIKRLNNEWWAEYCVGSCRDQLSFPYVFKDYHIFEGDIYNYKSWKR